ASCKQPDLALQAFSDAIQGGLEEGVHLLLDRSEAILRNKLRRIGEADAIHELHKHVNQQTSA
ncbi:MAG: hypothetical protein K9N51_11450, partial [Candidatus Pacebacteria bacterium]|nr:hypothetical protein [Candidatus Paceibacterota bacterium]